ncbi:ABC transporter substrate-binding protein [Deltaproteobacteria bacterium OttesenSCG-928-M10]|nr:ABC transporter substrate-binding protein [Deltaproteobacteria bacterium OttesenSCG-928-M10]
MTAPLAAQEKVLKVGVLGPFTGSQARVGDEFRMSTEMAMENIGYKIGDYKLEIVWIDSQFDAVKGTSAYAEAIERKGIDVGVLNWASPVAVSCMDLAATHKIPHIFGFGATAVINEKYHSDPEKYSYWPVKGWPEPSKLMKVYLDALEDAIAKGLWKPEKKTIAVCVEDHDYGRSAGPAIEKMFTEAGWEVVQIEYAPATQTDFYSLMGRFKSRNVAVVLINNSYPAMGAIIKQAKEVGLKSVIIADGMGWVGNWHEMIGQAGENVLDMIPQLATPEARAWAEKFEAKAGFKPSPSSGGLAYDGVNFLIRILERTLAKHGQLNKETIHEVIAGEVITGQLAFTRADGAIVMNAYRYTPETVPDPVLGAEGYFFPVLQYDQDGLGHIVYPPDVATSEFKAP